LFDSVAEVLHQFQVLESGQVRAFFGKIADHPHVIRGVIHDERCEGILGQIILTRRRA